MAIHTITVNTTAYGETYFSTYQLRDSGYIYRNGTQLFDRGDRGASIKLRADVSESDFFAWIVRQEQNCDHSIQVVRI